jgi:hypothetical protein
MMPEFAEWETFYVIVGASAGALIGLQFVVLTLIAEGPSIRGVAEASAALLTPTIVHFAAALLLSALVSVPWQTIFPSATLWGFTGLSGLAYIVIVVRRMRLQTAYKPQFEDWLFHVLLPIAAYAILVLSAVVAPSHTHEALLGVGASTLLLLFIGIHNAWDSVAYHVFVTRRNAETERVRSDNSAKEKS